MTGIASTQLVTAGWIVIVIYMFIILFFVIRGSLKIKSISDYAVGNIAFSPVAVGLSLAASMTSAATFIINPGFVALYGVSGVISLGLVVPIAALFSLTILTKGFRKYGSKVKALSLSQWIGSRYQSKGYALFFGFLSLLLLTFVVLICVGLTKVLSKTLNVEEIYILIGIVAFIFGYMMFGGANSMVYTNTVQASLMLVVAFILLGSGHEHFSNGVHGFLDRLRAIDPLLAQWTNPSSFLFRDFFEIFVCQIVVGIAIVCQPHIITKSLLLKTDQDVNKYLAVGIVAEFIFFIVVIAGLYARLMFPDLTVDGVPLKMDGIMSAYVVKEFPVYIGLIVIMGLVSAGISTLEGLIQALSTTITADIIKPLFGRYLPVDQDRRSAMEITINKGVILVLAVVTVFVSYDQLMHPKLSVGIFAQNGVYAYFAAAFVPLLFGMFLKNVPKMSPILASLTAVTVHFTMYYGKLPVPLTKATGENPGVAAAVAIMSSVLIGWLVLVLKRKTAAPEKFARAQS
ncbi:sodium/pantothenate symporter [candidate division CSSED10-310 bacterium]|uniref:Sodium/pantothenate symporter n=1 Tax=candidate division CSSED10-310 bacterium TaxID=2855610 RepID=A0ABV6Z1I8_UNCC1